MAENIAHLPPAGHRPLPERSGTLGLENDETATGHFWSTDGGPTFAEFLDIINPLQHIPIISTIYRAITGDEIGAAPRAIGGLLFGGPFGALSAGVMGLLEEASGGSVETQLAGLVNDLFGGEERPTTAIASADGAKSDKAVPTAAVATLATSDSAGEVDVAMMNRIAFNPAAALGVPLSKRPAAGATQVAFPAHPGTAFIPAASTTPAAALPNDSAAARLRAGTLPSQRAQADALVARWAEQQMARQAAAPVTGSDSKRQAEKEQTPQKAETAEQPIDLRHPMLPPKNASPEWYAAVMKSALDRYQAGQSVYRAMPQGYNPNH